MKSNRMGVAIIIILFVVILVGVWYLVVTPTPSVVDTSTATTTSNATSTVVATTTATSTPPVVSVTVSSPLPNATVEKTFTVTGVAPNNWYFEASFPIEVQDLKGKVVAQGHAQAQSDWTTPGPVAFTATIAVSNYLGQANLFLKRDNPSGLSQNDAEVIIPITIH